MKSLYDRNIEAAIKQGKTEGRKEGRMEGRNEGVDAMTNALNTLGIEMTPEQLEAARRLAMA